MQYLSAYTLASLSGKEPTEQDVTNILKATGKDVDAKKVAEVIKSLKGKQIHDLISKGQSKVGGAATGGATKTEAPKDNKKKEEKPKGKPVPPPVEEPAAEDEDFNLDLFG